MAFLDRLQEVGAAQEDRPLVAQMRGVGAIGLGHDVSMYYSEGIVISSTDELTGRVLPFLAGLFEDRPLLGWPQRSIP